jgi:hypothetical protein
LLATIKFSRRAVVLHFVGRTDRFQKTFVLMLTNSARGDADSRGAMYDDETPLDGCLSDVIRTKAVPSVSTDAVDNCPHSIITVIDY